MRFASLAPEVCHRAIESRDPRFDGQLVVAVTTTNVFCRPSCPSRAADPVHRRFFDSATSAQDAGFRPCRRCRPGAAPCERDAGASPHLARVAAQRIASGALNGRSVRDLAAELKVSARHLRRCVRRAVGASPMELALIHRLLNAQRLLTDSNLSVSRVAYASGFQSLRRFNAVFRERWHMTPGEIRRNPAVRASEREPLTLRLGYSAPLAWKTLLMRLRTHSIPGVELVAPGLYGSTVYLDGWTGYVLARHDAVGRQIEVDVSLSLAPVLVPLVVRLRRLFDLDAQPAVIDRHLNAAGLGKLTSRRPGVRLPGALDGFRAAMAAFLFRGIGDPFAARESAGRIVRTLGSPLRTGVAGLGWLAPGSARLADAGVWKLRALGVPPQTARAIHRLARLHAGGELSLEPHEDPAAALRTLRSITSDEVLVSAVIVRTLGWPDGFAASDVGLQRAAGAEDGDRFERRARGWRPWRAYACEHLRVAEPGGHS